MLGTIYLAKGEQVTMADVMSDGWRDFTRNEIFDLDITSAVRQIRGDVRKLISEIHNDFKKKGVKKIDQKKAAKDQKRRVEEVEGGGKKLPISGKMQKAAPPNDKNSSDVSSSSISSHFQKSCAKRYSPNDLMGAAYQARNRDKVRGSDVMKQGNPKTTPSSGKKGKIEMQQERLVDKLEDSNKKARRRSSRNT
jgi:hypothetical protein